MPTKIPSRYKRKIPKILVDNTILTALEPDYENGYTYTGEFERGHPKHLYKFPTCLVCGKIEGIRPCERCHLGFYCSRKCQRADYKGNHQLICRALGDGRKSMSAFEKAVKNSADLFESKVTSWTGIVLPPARVLPVLVRVSLRQESKMYAQEAAKFGAKVDLMISRVPLRYKYLHEAALKSLIKGWAFDVHGRNGIEWRIAVVLLKLHRDEDCYNFVKTNLILKEYSKKIRDDFLHLILSQKEDWVYYEKHDRLEDPVILFAQFGRQIDLAAATIILLIKLRLLAIYKHAVRQLKALSQCTKLDNEILYFKVLPMLLGKNAYEKYSVVETHVKMCMLWINVHNKELIPGAIDPRRLSTVRHEVKKGRGTNEEAYMVLFYSMDVFDYIPGSRRFMLRYIRGMMYKE